MITEGAFEGRFGLERETLRVDKNGRTAQTPHPFDDAQLERDFCENQLEIITSPRSSIREMLEELKELDSKARTVLNKKGESLWMNSNPPYIENENDIPIATFFGNKEAKYNYRLKLQRRYGKRLMTYSGIHFNMSFSDKYISAVCGGAGKQEKNKFYLKLAKQLMKHSWLLVLLTASSPVYDLSFDGGGRRGLGFAGYASMRSGDRGYWNQFELILDYADIDSYVKSVENYVNKGVLFSAGELYIPIRLKPKGENSLKELTENGINHIELRMFDINPLEELGISENDLNFAHFLAIYLLSLDDFVFTPEQQLQALKNYKAAALYDIKNVKIDEENIKDAAEKILSDMKKYFIGRDKALTVIDYECEKLRGERNCEKIYNMTGSVINNV